MSKRAESWLLSAELYRGGTVESRYKQRHSGCFTASVSYGAADHERCANGTFGEN
jgi:hypothetical protein